MKTIILLVGILTLGVMNTQAQVPQPKPQKNSDIAFFVGGLVAMSEKCGLYPIKKTNEVKAKQKEKQLSMGESEVEFEKFFKEGYDMIAKDWDKMSMDGRKEQCEQAKWLIGSER